MLTEKPRCIRCLDRFLFASCSPATCVLLRIAYGSLLIVYLAVLLPDVDHWFSNQGVLQAETARQLFDPPGWSLFFIFDASPTLVRICLGIVLVQAVAMLLGCYSRFQAACIFVWLVSFQHRNPLILDGGDTLFRLLALMLAFMPLDAAWSITRCWRGPPEANWWHVSPRAWAVRLVQCELTLVYLSSAISKAFSETWRDGTALYFVYQMGDLYGRGWLPEWLTTQPTTIRLTTWSVVAFEAVLPCLLWWRRTRILAIILGIGFHLGLEYAMHLFLFQWIMMVALLSFVQPRRP